LPKLKTGGGGDFDLVFNRRQYGIESSDYLVEISSSLDPNEWTLLDYDKINAIAHPTLSGFDQVTVSVPFDVARRFIRLQLR
jgi:hypothetical protein